MKRFLTLCLLVAITAGAYAQRAELSTDLCLRGTLNEAYESYPKGTPVALRKVIKLSKQNVESLNGVVMAVEVEGVQRAIPVEALKQIDFAPASEQEFWQYIFLREGMYQHYESKGYRYDLRQDLAEESNKYLQDLAGLYYEDAYIEDYVQAVFAQTTPPRIANKRPEVLSLRLLKSTAPDAYMLPNGTMLISTGLLSTLDSQDELMAIIASEMAHYLLDHQVVNVGKAESRARRADFWGAVLSGVAEGVDQVLYDRCEYYVPGTSYVAAELVAALINTGTTTRLGMTYTRKQEKEADQIALDFLRFKHIDPAALASALTKIKNYSIAEHDYYNLSRYGNYAELDERIAKLGEVKTLKSHPYLKAMSGVTTYNAILQQTSKRYESSARLAQKNIDNKVYSDDDYIILAKANMGLLNTPEANEQSLQLLHQAMKMSTTPNLNAYKQEILLLLRMNKQAQASDALKDYLDLIAKYQQQAGSGNEADWAAAEGSWAHKLLLRISLF
ncbi:MAG: M48 family metalloprotease [Bacteroides sp.]